MIDGDALSSVKITALPTAGTLKLDGTPIASGALPKAVAAADLAAGKLTYTPPPNANKTAYASFTFKVNDGTVDSAQYTMTIDVTAVNDAATGAPTISGTAEVGQTLTASTANISDVDGVPNSFTYRWIRVAANGTTFESNIGADARTYTLTESEEGKKVKVEVRFRDHGGSPEGPLLSAAYPASLSQTVAARPVVNTLPTAANGTVTTNEDTDYTFSAAEFSYADDDGDALSSVKITGLPTAGTLKLDGTPIASGALPKAVAAADLAAGKLTYTPPANANGPGYASFTFRVNDGTADSAQYTITINVTPVNDAPTASARTVTTKRRHRPHLLGRRVRLRRYRWRCAVEREDHRAAHRGHAEAGRHDDRLGRPAEGGRRGRPGRRKADVHPAAQREQDGLRELHVQSQRRDGRQRPHVHHDHRRHRRERCGDGCADDQRHRRGGADPDRLDRQYLRCGRRPQLLHLPVDTLRRQRNHVRVEHRRGCAHVHADRE